MRSLVAGVDSSTQSCKITIRDANTGALVRSGAAKHATGTQVDPQIWLRAFNSAVKEAGGLADVQALSIGAQQHGMVAIDEDGQTVRDAMLWNDTKAASSAQELITEQGNGDVPAGKNWWAKRIGLVPVASFTVSKLRWLAKEEPENFAKTAAIALPHDWLMWKLKISSALEELATDRSDASGTGYFNPETNSYDHQIIELATSQNSKKIVLPRIVSPGAIAGVAEIDGHEIALGAGCGDNASAALGLGAKDGQVILSIGTSGVISMISSRPIKDVTGVVANFADASGKYLPLVATLNASRVLDAYQGLLGVSHEEFSRLALTAPPGAEGLVCLPYLEGERTPNLPEATGELYGIRLSNLSRANVARAAVEGMLCGVGEGIRALRNQGVEVSSVILVGGGARSEAVRRIAPSVLGMPVYVPERGEYVADGAALQAAWALSGQSEPPAWVPRLNSEYSGIHQPFIKQRFDEIKDAVIARYEQGRKTRS